MTRRLIYFALVIALATAAYSVDYMYVSDCEMTVFGDRIRFWHGDTLSGPVRTNFPGFGSMTCPVFLDLVITPEPGPPDSSVCGPDYFHNWRFNEGPVVIPERLCHYRELATRHYDPGLDKQMRCSITGSEVTLYTWDLGVAFDSAASDMTVENFNLGLWPEIIFTETPLELMGTDITGDVTICSAKLIRLMDDVRVGGQTSGPPEYRVSENNPNFVTIASEGDIKIANTWANGRENSSGMGNGQTNPNLSDIVITAALYALGNTGQNGMPGSFTFENQNDPDSGYVFNGSPDDRGVVFLYGALAQRRRGYMHRSNNSSTGYLKQWRWDERLRTRPEWVVGEVSQSHSTDTLNFGDVPVDSSVWDTARIDIPCGATLGFPLTSPPYSALYIPPYHGSHLRVPVRFTPPHAGSFPGMLQVQTSYRLFQIPLRGHGVQGGSPNGLRDPSFNLSAAPNPFNVSTVFTLSLPARGPVSLRVYDITGRLASTILQGEVAPGVKRITFDARDLPSGVYFARLDAAGQVKTTKILLVK